MSTQMKPHKFQMYSSMCQAQMRPTVSYAHMPNAQHERLASELAEHQRDVAHACNLGGDGVFQLPHGGGRVQ
eukprot:CAMPEP_0183504976 /NCGR_PEP_ID=MMETSP0371-20130417/6336_1 /TAXON_ID=268820 /ORGANISM="Peridinium aciculiferum, Strain PAER-2" /LENGTH=71 /DNA_ID=CAMNT_0025700535 /DNA_START=92 /DNA_END=304 /DNA_ORIENTATION=+